MKSAALFAILFCLLSAPVFGQSTASGLAVSRDADPVPIEELVQKAEAATPDTAKAKMLLQISRFYWYQGKTGNLDTMIEFSKQAFLLSRKLQFQEGIAESIFLQCKALTEKDYLPAATHLLSLVYGEQRIRLLLVLAERYVNQRPIDIPDLDKALPYINKSLQLSDSVQSTHWRYETLILMGKYHFEHGELKKGKETILQIISDCHRRGNLQQEAHFWSELDRYTPRTDDNYTDHALACRNAYETFLRAGRNEDALGALRDWAQTELWYDHLDTAEQQFKRVLKIHQQLHKTPSANTLLSIAELYLHKDELAKCLSYALQGLNALKPGDQRLRFAFNYFLAESYSRLDQVANQLVYAQTCLEIAIRNKFPDRFYFTRYIVEGKIKQDSAPAALAFLTRFAREQIPISPVDKEAIAYGFALIYDHLGDYDKAEKYYLEMERLDKEARKEQSRIIFTSVYFAPSDAAVSIGTFYTRWKRYREARPYLAAALADSTMARQTQDRKTIELMLFQTDSALGNFRSAIHHYRQYSALNDSTFNIEKIRQFQELQVRYESKEQQQSIQLLESQAREEQIKLREANRQRNITLAGITFVLIAALWGYRSYHTLRRVISEKDQLLTDKDLLLKEIHHRVKNNLQLIVSLLDSQSMYLNNTAAQAALQDTQNRIKTISLLHQKLYRLNMVTRVNMSAYILEIINYLNETFDTSDRQIAFTYSIAPLTLDVSEALPIGVILNEAVTNSIKYAFPDHRKGEINVSLSKIETGGVCLRIKDNGIGFPENFSYDKQESMGLVLIKGLSQQLNGKLSIESTDGVVVTVRFMPQFNTEGRA